MSKESHTPNGRSPQEQLGEIYREAAERTRQRRANFIELRKELAGDEWELSMLDDLDASCANFLTMAAKYEEGSPDAK